MKTVLKSVVIPLKSPRSIERRPPCSENICREPSPKRIWMFSSGTVSGHLLLFVTGGSASTASAPNPLPSLEAPTLASTRASFNLRNLSIRLSPGNAGIGSTSLQLPRLLLPCSPHMLTLWTFLNFVNP